jgi:hypothetical protein
MFVESPLYEISVMVFVLLALAGPWLETLTRVGHPDG